MTKTNESWHEYCQIDNLLEKYKIITKKFVYICVSKNFLILPRSVEYSPAQQTIYLQV